MTGVLYYKRSDGTVVPVGGGGGVGSYLALVLAADLTLPASGGALVPWTQRSKVGTDLSFANGRVTVNRAGDYLLTLATRNTFSAAPPATPIFFQTQVVKNAGGVVGGGSRVAQAIVNAHATTGPWNGTTAVVITLAAGDTLECFAVAAVAGGGVLQAANGETAFSLIGLTGGGGGGADIESGSTSPFGALPKGTLVSCNWQRVGKVVTMSGRINAIAPALTAGQTLAIPVTKWAVTARGDGPANDVNSPQALRCVIGTDGTFTLVAGAATNVSDITFSLSFGVA